MKYRYRVKGVWTVWLDRSVVLPRFYPDEVEIKQGRKITRVTPIFEPEYADKFHLERSSDE